MFQTIHAELTVFKKQTVEKTKDVCVIDNCLHFNFFSVIPAKMTTLRMSRTVTSPQTREGHTLPSITMNVV